MPRFANGFTILAPAPCPFITRRITRPLSWSIISGWLSGLSKRRNSISSTLRHWIGPFAVAQASLVCNLPDEEPFARGHLTFLFVLFLFFSFLAVRTDVLQEILTQQAKAFVDLSAQLHQLHEQIKQECSVYRSFYENYLRSDADPRDPFDLQRVRQAIPAFEEDEAMNGGDAFGMYAPSTIMAYAPSPQSMQMQMPGKSVICQCLPLCTNSPYSVLYHYYGMINRAGTK